MSLRTIGYMVLILVLMLLSMYLLGMGTTFFIVAFLFLIMGIIFTINKNFYDRYVTYMNPKIEQMIKEKGEKFNRKNRITNIVSYYILSVVFAFNGLLNTSRGNERLELNEILQMLLIIIPITALIVWVSYFIFKKSKSFSTYLLWSIIAGVSAAIIIVFMSILFIFMR